MPDQPLQLSERGELPRDRPFARRVDVAHHAQVDGVEHVDAQVVEYRLPQVGRALCRVPRRVRTAHRAHLGHNREVVDAGLRRRCRSTT